MLEIGAWTTFFSVQVGATAALSGLVIVAISINLVRILSFSYLPGRAAETLIVLVGSMVLSSLTLTPTSAVALGGLCLALAAIVWTTCVVIQARAYRRSADAPPGAFALRVLLTQVTIVPMIVGSALLLANDSAGLYWLAASALLAVVTAVLATWILLVEILR